MFSTPSHQNLGSDCGGFPGLSPANFNEFIHTARAPPGAPEQVSNKEPPDSRPGVLCERDRVKSQIRPGDDSHGGRLGTHRSRTLRIIINLNVRAGGPGSSIGNSKPESDTRAAGPCGADLMKTNSLFSGLTRDFLPLSRLGATLRNIISGET